VAVGAYHTLGDARGVYVVGDYVYVAAGGAGLRVIDVSNPITPVEVGVYAPQFARSVFVAADLAFIATEQSGLWVIDVSDPAAPVAVGDFDTTGSANGSYVTDDDAYVADGVGGLVILRLPL
jgi:hypothetical protein